MITPPPIIRRKKTSPLAIVAMCLLGCVALWYVVGPLFLLFSIFRTPTITEDDYLHGVKETPATLEQLGFKGSVIATRDNTLTLYTAEEETEFYSSDWRIYDLAGPNKQGHLVIFEINRRTDDYRFIVLDFKTGTLKTAHQGSGDVIWDSVVGEMAMHPLEDKVAYFSETGNRQYPGAYMSVGKLVELDLATQSKTTIATNVIENEFTYSANGDSIFFSRSTDDSQPQITEKVLKSGELKRFGDGWSCELSHDASSLLIFDRDRALVRSLDLKSGKVADLATPDYYFWPIAYVSDSLILASSLPLTKETAEYFPPTGSISGAHLKMRLGVFEPTAKRAAILKTDLDRYDPTVTSTQRLSAKAFKREP